jgi:hypothetical protein
MGSTSYQWDNLPTSQSKPVHTKLHFEPDQDKQGGTLTVSCDDRTRSYRYQGLAHQPDPTDLRDLEEWPIEPDDEGYVTDVAELFGVTLE